MEMTWNAILWHQFGAAMDMLDNALRACPDELWRERLYHEGQVQAEFAEFWYLGFHAIFWLDFYLSDSMEGFTPPAPFTLSELEPGQLPDRVYTCEELLDYLAHCRNKCRAKLESLAGLLAPQRIRLDWLDMSVAELLLYNMRHIQEHAAQLSLFLGQKVGSAPGWVSRARSNDSGA